jgi:aminopeptidase N
MTDMVAALACLVNVEGPDRSASLERFYRRFANEALVVDKWFAIQASSERAALLDELPQLVAHPTFSLSNPNRARALIEGFGFGNPYRFHDLSGRGYRFVADCALKIDAFNPQVAARMVAPLTRFQRFEARRRDLMVTVLTQLLGAPRLSNDLYEQVSKALEVANQSAASDAPTP